jgi:phosphate:Na+ symporter
VAELRRQGRWWATTAALAVMLGADVGTALMAGVLVRPVVAVAAADLRRRGAVHHAPERHAGRIGRVLIGLGLITLALQLIVGPPRR